MLLLSSLGSCSLRSSKRRRQDLYTHHGILHCLPDNLVFTTSSCCPLPHLPYERNDDGLVNEVEFRQAVLGAGLNLERQQLEELFSAIDEDKTGSVDVVEFVAIFEEARRVLSGTAGDLDFDEAEVGVRGVDENEDAGDDDDEAKGEDEAESKAETDVAAANAAAAAAAATVQDEPLVGTEILARQLLDTSRRLRRAMKSKRNQDRPAVSPSQMIVLLDQFGQLANVCLHLSRQQSGGNVDLSSAASEERDIKRLRARVAELERERELRGSNRHRGSKRSAVTPSLVRGLLKRSSALSQRIAEGEVAINSLLGLAERCSSRLKMAEAALQTEVGKRQELQSKLERLQANSAGAGEKFGKAGSNKTPAHGMFIKGTCDGK